jgi:hypothetical protein
VWERESWLEIIGRYLVSQRVATRELNRGDNGGKGNPPNNGHRTSYLSFSCRSSFSSLTAVRMSYQVTAFSSWHQSQEAARCSAREMLRSVSIGSISY